MSMTISLSGSTRILLSVQTSFIVGTTLVCRNIQSDICFLCSAFRIIRIHVHKFRPFLIFTKNGHSEWANVQC